jgi:hypothetical protein
MDEKLLKLSTVKIGKKACRSDLFKLSCKNLHKKADYILNVLYEKFIFLFPFYRHVQCS